VFRVRRPRTPESIPLSVDRAVGDRVGGAVAAHHRRRLARIGWLHAVDAPAGAWAAGEPPPRPGNTLEVLVDGAQAFPRIATELARAQSHVYLTGWYFSPDFELTRKGEPKVFRNLLAELAPRVDIRVLLWAGAPLPLFRPSRRDVREVDANLSKAGIRCALDRRERPMHCHHEKTIVVDDRLAFVGGIDITSQDGDRFDTNGHHARAQLGWHDVTTCFRGPAVADVSAHFRMRWKEVTGEELPPPPPQAEEGTVELQIVRTVPEHIYAACPRGDFSILESYVRALRGAERLVYLENQFLWSREIIEILCDKLRSPPRDDFRMVALLPAKPKSGDDDTRGGLAELVEADGGAGRFLACTLVARFDGLFDPVYVHAKVGIVDDRWLTIGSANLNEHSLFNDTEMNVVTHDPALARQTRLRLWAEHLELSRADVEGDPVDLVERHWKPVSKEQLARRTAGQPLTHRLVLLPHVSRRSARLLGPLQGLLVDG
jgi:phosphatidylserine/phosphatidylglycerophosphate/cardiolipin synthase-like enzyme